jgi:hypothetical protein
VALARERGQRVRRRSDRSARAVASSQKLAVRGQRVARTRETRETKIEGERKLPKVRATRAAHVLTLQ